MKKLLSIILLSTTFVSAVCASGVYTSKKNPNTYIDRETVRIGNDKYDFVVRILTNADKISVYITSFKKLSEISSAIYIYDTTSIRNLNKLLLEDVKSSNRATKSTDYAHKEIIKWQNRLNELQSLIKTLLKIEIKKGRKTLYFFKNKKLQSIYQSKKSNIDHLLGVFI